MLADIQKKKIEAATVSIQNTSGRGVLIFGDLVLTAAHCVNWQTEGAMMAMEDWFPEPVKPANTEPFILTPVAIEPLSDIAVLGEIDDEESYLKFEEFRESTKPVRICETAFKNRESQNVYLLDREMNWVEAKITSYSLHDHFGRISIQTKAIIRGGCSGGPVVNSLGEIVGVVSHLGGTPSQEDKDLYIDGGNGRIPIAHLALPVWVRNKIFEAQRE
jgi:hypothetical protein